MKWLHCQVVSFEISLELLLVRRAAMPWSYLTAILSLACNTQCSPSTFFRDRATIAGIVLLWWSCFISQLQSDNTRQVGFFGLRLRNPSETMSTFATHIKDKLTENKPACWPNSRDLSHGQDLLSLTKTTATLLLLSAWHSGLIC